MKWPAIIAGFLFSLALGENIPTGRKPVIAASPTRPALNAWPGSWPADPGVTPMRGCLGLTREGRSVDAWYFPGKTDRRALIIGGVHGSELASVTLAQMLIEDLQHGLVPDFSVIIIPVLFPDNAATAMQQPQEIGSVKNIGRISGQGNADPNRQMPGPGQAFHSNAGIDYRGRVIERENQYLLELIQRFRPDRIASLHAIRNEKQAGFFADPRTDAHGIAIGFAADSILAMQMAFESAAAGFTPPGNFRNGKNTAHYFLDPAPVPAGQWQARNTKGSWQPAGRGQGITLGTWCSTAVEWETDPALNRPAIPILTIECPGSRRPVDCNQAAQWTRFGQLKAYVSALENVFLKKETSK